MFEQFYSFTFEAAHELGANVGHDTAHPYTYIHGHSFEATVTLRAQTISKEGWVEDFAAVRAACEDVRGQLDHRFLNHIEGLERPTLENLAQWIYRVLHPRLPHLTAIDLARPSLKERVRYTPM